MNLKKILALGAVFGASLAAAGAAQARDDVQFSLSIGAPAWGVAYAPQPAWGYAPQPAWGYEHHRHESWREYREPTRWDRDGDGIPNRYDRVYNPRWDRDGDGVPNRRDPHPDRPDWRRY